MRPAELALVAQIRAELRDGSATAARGAAGLKQAEVARSLKVSRQSVSQWESGDAVPTDEHALAYGRLLRQLGKAAA
jgi:DNA-binding transcriptional regulator YiaG